METKEAGLTLMFPPGWVRSCWGSCPRWGGWGTRSGSWRVCQCCSACCTASTWSCCGASPGSWSSSARIPTPGWRSGAGAGCSNFSGCWTGLWDWAIIAYLMFILSQYLYSLPHNVFQQKHLLLSPICASFFLIKQWSELQQIIFCPHWSDLWFHSLRNLVLYLHKVWRLTEMN